MTEMKTLKLTMSGKVDMRGKIKTSRLTKEQVKKNAYQSCKIIIKTISKNTMNLIRNTIKRIRKKLTSKEN